MSRKAGYYDECRGAFFHPGGFELTKKAVEYCRFPEGSVIADIGCGTGDSARLIEETLKINVLKVEPSAAMSHGDLDIISAVAEELPFAENSLDCGLCECVLSLCDDISVVLRELCRVIKLSGYLIISDVYSKSERFLSVGMTKWFYTKEDYCKFLNYNGFDIILFEDYTSELVNMVVRLIMEGCESRLFSGIERKYAGYFVIIAKKLCV